MIRIALMKVPFGIQDEAFIMSIGAISNDGTGAHNKGNYEYHFSSQRNSEDNKLRTWRKGRVTGFPRLQKNAWYLLYQILKEIYEE